MASFSVKTNNIKGVVTDLSDSASMMRDYYAVLNRVKGSAMPTLARYGNVRKQLEQVISKCDGYGNKLNKMSGKLDEIITLYITTEGKLVDYSSVQNPSTVHPSLPSDKELIAGSDQVSEEESKAWDYVLRSLEQILLGSFTEESTMLGIVGSVLIGCTPIGWIADVRDILGDIYQFRDGADTEEVISLIVDVVAIIPLCDLLKYADECLGVTKYLDDAGEALVGVMEYARGTWKSADDVITKVDDLVDKSGEFISNVINKIPDDVKVKTIKTVKKLTTEIGDSTVGGVIKDVALEAIGVEDKLIEAAADAIDNIGSGITTGIENVKAGWDNMWDMITGQPEPSYT